MRFAFSIFLLIFIALGETSCAHHSSLVDGIVSFKAQDYRRAFILLKPEALKGQPDAQYAVGYMYYYGQGVMEDWQKAWIWINRAASAGQPNAIEAIKILKQQPKI